MRQGSSLDAPTATTRNTGPTATTRNIGPIAAIVRAARALRRALVALLSAPLHLYRYAISPLLPPSCRFYPSCSSYALEAMQRHGPLGGALLAVGRVCRCHPWNDGGVDPVPETFSLRARAFRWPAALRGDPPARTD
jgi:putative membrane protein insertion efficiency factor